MKTNKQLTLAIFICFVSSVGCVIALFAFSNEMGQRPGSFLRQLPPHPVLEGDTLNLHSNAYYFAGGTRSTIYLGNYKSPLDLLVVHLTDMKTERVALKVGGLLDQKFWSLKISVDSPYFFLTDGAVPRIYRGRIENWSAERFNPDSIYNRDIVPLSSSSFVVKTLNDRDENVIGKISASSPRYVHNDSVLKKQVDGRFCTDGILCYDKPGHTIIYLYYYRNQFTVLDTALNVKHVWHTIDTTTRADIKTGPGLKKNQYTLLRPPVFVNNGCAVEGNLLFVNSSNPSRNQPANTLRESAVIDVYDLRNGRYKLSFLIFNFGSGRHLTNFAVYGRKLIVLYDDVLQVYTMDDRYFDDPAKS